MVEKKGKEMWESMSDEKKNIYGEELYKFQIESMKHYVASGVSLSPNYMF